MAYQRRGYGTGYSKKPAYIPKPEIVKQPRIEREWSEYQKALFADIANGKGNTQVDALAGSGKTSSVVEGFYYVPFGSTSLMCAFNKSIQTELASRAPAGVEVLTLHSLGYRACRKAFSKLGAPYNDKLPNHIKAQMGDAQEEYDLRSEMKKAVSLCKGYLADDVDSIDVVLDRHGIDTDPMSRPGFIARVQSVMNACKKDTARVDFDDMIWFPNVHELPLPKFDFVFIDEAQDLNESQINLALNSCTDNGRIISVGDQYQAIYGFRGASSDAIQNIVERCNSKRLPLSVTYRCAKSIVQLAQSLVPQLEYAPNAEEGLVSEITEKQVEELVKPGDFILSRINAPLIKWCLALLRARIPANIQGRDMGETLMVMIKKSRAKDIVSFLSWLGEWKERECERLIALKRDPSSIEDKAECLITLSEDAGSIDEMKENIKKLFHDGDDKDRVILSSTHKAKGLERDRVFVLSDTYKPERSQEEKNLQYVAWTRSRKELYLVR